MADDDRDPAWAELADVERWAAEVRARDAADARVRERWLRRSAEEEAELAGVLLDLAERGVTAVVTTSSGRRHPAGWQPWAPTSWPCAPAPTGRR